MPNIGTALRTILTDPHTTCDPDPLLTAAIQRTYSALAKANAHEWVHRRRPRAGFPAAVLLEALRRKGITRVRVVNAARQSLATTQLFGRSFPGSPALLITTDMGPVIATPETRIIAELRPKNAQGTRFSCARALLDFAEDLTEDERLDRVDALIEDRFENKRFVGVDDGGDPFVSWPSGPAEAVVAGAADWAAGLLDRA